MDTDQTCQFMENLYQLSDKTGPEMDPFEFLNMSAFDELSAGNNPPTSNFAKQECLTSAGGNAAAPPAAFTLPPSVAPISFTPSGYCKPRPPPSTFQSFSMASFGPHRTFPAPSAGQPAVRQRQDSDIHSVRYDSPAESSFYESPWFSSSSQSHMSPGSPQSGYQSTSSMQDFTRPHVPRHDGHPYHRPTASYTFGAGRAVSHGKRGSMDSNIASRAMALGLRASSDEASPSAVKSEHQDDGNDDDADDNMELAGSDDESEYVESRCSASARKRARKAHGADQTDEGDESEFADMRGPELPRPNQVRNTRLQSERKRRNALSSAFQDLRSLLPADIQRATKSHVLESAADEIRKTRMERDKYRQALKMLKAEKGITGYAGEEPILPPMPAPM